MASRRSARLHLDGSVRSQAVKLVAQYVGVLSKGTWVTARTFCVHRSTARTFPIAACWGCGAGADSDPHLDEFMQRAHVADQLIASLSAKVDALEESVTGSGRTMHRRLDQPVHGLAYRQERPTESWAVWG